MIFDLATFIAFMAFTRTATVTAQNPGDVNFYSLGDCNSTSYTATYDSSWAATKENNSNSCTRPVCLTLQTSYLSADFFGDPGDNRTCLYFQQNCGPISDTIARPVHLPVGNTQDGSCTNVPIQISSGPAKPIELSLAFACYAEECLQFSTQAG